MVVPGTFATSLYQWSHQSGSPSNSEYVLRPSEPLWNIFKGEKNRGSKERGKCWIVETSFTFYIWFTFTNRQRESTKVKQEVSIPNPFFFFIGTVDIALITLNMSLTCLRGSLGVGGSGGPNVLKPSASEGQAGPGLGHPLLLCQPPSITGPATAETPRSKNKVNQTTHKHFSVKDTRHRFQLLINTQHTHIRGLAFDWNIFRDIKAVREGTDFFLQALEVQSYFLRENGITGSRGICTCNFIRHCQILLQSSCTTLYSNQQRRQIPVLFPYQYLLLLVIFILAILWVAPHCGFKLHFFDK